MKKPFYMSNIEIRETERPQTFVMRIEALYILMIYRVIKIEVYFVRLYNFSTKPQFCKIYFYISIKI